MEPLHKQKNQGLINDLNMYLGNSIWLENHRKKKDVEIKQISTEDNHVDSLTKSLFQHKCHQYLEQYGI